jgi:PAS domain S-box-containing protein
LLKAKQALPFNAGSKIPLFRIYYIYFMHSSPQSAALFNNASMGIVVVNNKGLIELINPFALNLFGYKNEELIEKPIEFLIPRRYHHQHVKDRQAYTHNPRNRPMGLGMDLYGMKKDGTEFPVEVSLGHYENNGVENVIAFLSDISVRKKAETEIKKLNDELESLVEQRTRELTAAMRLLESSKEDLSQALQKEKELGELKSRFVSMASHEFRTPLSTVLSSAYLIEKYTTTEDQPKREKHLQRIISSVNMLTDILNDFLSLGKIEEGKIQVRLSEFNIKEQVKAITEEIKNALKRGQEILYDHEGNVNVIMDASLLKHIVMNLVSNASKFSPEASMIEIKSLCSNGRVVLSVKDHGIGISPEDQKHLMERFFRGANAVNIQGTGLGLHIISKYAELMNGQVECKSELEKGTEFIITFEN